MTYAFATIQGTLGRDAEVSQTKNGTQYVKWSMAVNHGRGDKQETTWFSCVSFRETIAKLSQYLTKGKTLAVHGTLKMNTWTAQDGTQRTAPQVDVSEVTFLNFKREEGQQDGQPAQQQRRAAPRRQYQAPPANRDDINAAVNAMYAPDAAPEREPMPFHESDPTTPSGEEIPF